MSMQTPPAPAGAEWEYGLLVPAGHRTDPTAVPPESRTKVVKAAIERARKYQDDPDGTRDPSMPLMFVIDLPELEEADLHGLAYLLWHGEWGCCKNDVTGLLDLFQKWVDGQTGYANAE